MYSIMLYLKSKGMIKMEKVNTQNDKKVLSRAHIYLFNICVLPILWLISIPILTTFIIESEILFGILFLLTPFFPIYGMVKLVKIRKKYPNQKSIKSLCSFGRIYFILFMGFYIFSLIVFIFILINS